MNTNLALQALRVHTGARIGDVAARRILENAWPEVMGETPMTVSVLQGAQVVGRAESFYGQAWKDQGIGCNNWGAIQAGSPPCGAGSFTYTDTHPNPDGTFTPYEACFRCYDSPEQGAADLLRVLYAKRPNVLEAAQAGDLEAFSAAMYESGYYEGWGATREERIANHVKYLQRNLDSIVNSLNERQALNGNGADDAPSNNQLSPLEETKSVWDTGAAVFGLAAAFGLVLSVAVMR